MNKITRQLRTLYIQNPNITSTIYFDLFHRVFNEVIQVSSFKDALQVICDDDNIDIILTNIMFPTSETIEFLKTIKNNNNKAKIVVISDRYLAIQSHLKNLNIMAFSECLDIKMLLEYIENLASNNKQKIKLHKTN